MMKSVIEMMKSGRNDEAERVESTLPETDMEAEESTEGEPEEIVEAPETEETPEEPVERPYTLRSLKDRDLFPFLKILRKIGLKEFKDAFNHLVVGESDENVQSVQGVGAAVMLDIAGTIVEHIGAAEDDLYSLYSDMSGIPADAIREMEFGTLPLMILDSFSEAKNTSFFKVLSRLL